MPPIRVFLDTSALFAAIWSAEGGGRLALKLGEAGVVQLVLSRQVLAELEGALRGKAPASLVSLALLLDRIRVEIAPEPDHDVLAACEALVTHRGDSMVVAAAVASRTEYSITLDRKHLLENARLGAAVPFLIGTPGDFIAWARARLPRPA